MKQVKSPSSPRSFGLLFVSRVTTVEFCQARLIILYNLILSEQSGGEKKKIWMRIAIIFSLLFRHFLTKPPWARQSKGLFKGDLRMSSLMDDALYSPVHNTVHFYLNSNYAIRGPVRVRVCACAPVCVRGGPWQVPFVVFIVDNEVEPLLKRKTKAERCYRAGNSSPLLFHFLQHTPTNTHTHSTRAHTRLITCAATIDALL